ncbi:MAG: GNAT family N-acetyltransferase [Clostridiales bacterium]|nr:GNAT family N-acetyltransferase [Clostridiales bacterium]
MQIIYFSKAENKEHWIKEISKSDWRAAVFLAGILREEKLKESFGDSTEFLLLVEGEKLISFCTYADKDEIDDSSLTPWVGFVYTFPEYRGMRRVGKLLEHAYMIAKENGFKIIYISSEEEGLYEKYGFTFWKMMKNKWSEETRIYRMPIVNRDYSDVIGKTVSGTIDRPINSAHPNHPDMIYPINYGYVDGIFAADGDEQDVYVFGTEEPLSKFEGKVVGVIHRLNDCEDKWIVSLDGNPVDRDTILRTTEFQEQYYMSELYI